LEEAERGYKKTLDLGNYELSTWLSRTDILIQLGEYEASILNLIQAAEFYPETAEIEFRLAGLHYTLMESEKGQYHLKNGMLLNDQYHFILDELFPNILNKSSIEKFIAESKKSSG
jgi:tetratricopeptide (TPR) repeat protein